MPDKRPVRRVWFDKTAVRSSASNKGDKNKTRVYFPFTILRVIFSGNQPNVLNRYLSHSTLIHDRELFFLGNFKREKEESKISCLLIGSAGAAEGPT